MKNIPGIPYHVFREAIMKSRGMDMHTRYNDVTIFIKLKYYNVCTFKSRYEFVRKCYMCAPA